MPSTTPFPLVIRFNEKHDARHFMADSPAHAAAIFVQVAKERLEYGYYETVDEDDTGQLDFFAKPKVSAFALVNGLVAIYDEGEGRHPQTGRELNREQAAMELYEFMKQRSNDGAQYEGFAVFDQQQMRRPKEVRSWLYSGAPGCGTYLQLPNDWMTVEQKTERAAAYRKRRDAEDAALRAQGIDPVKRDEDRFAVSARNRYWRDQVHLELEADRIRRDALARAERDIEQMYKQKQRG